MQPAEVLKYIENPQLLNKQSVKQLQKLVEDFPYFQSAHILLSIASKKWDASTYQQSLKKTAIVVTNRTHLFDLIHKFEKEGETPPTREKIISEPVTQHSDVAATKSEEALHEINVLKATEILSENAANEKNSEIEKPVLSPEQILERQIQNQVVNSFVEKEILKTPELHHPKQKEIPESFVEWLSLLKKNNGQTYAQIEEQLNAAKTKNKSLKPKEEKPLPPEKESQTKKEKNRALIDKIIESSPGLIRSKEDQKFFTADNKAKESLIENEHLVTETLAKIYALQGSVNKAVRAYEILSLKFPQKSAYFATLIQKLKSNQ